MRPGFLCGIRIGRQNKNFVSRDLQEKKKKRKRLRQVADREADISSQTGDRIVVEEHTAFL
jgi:hypothetical protein